MRHFFHQMKFIKGRDLLAVFAFLFALPISWIYKRKRKGLWLVCERSDEARDNGYWFYKYMREKHPEQDCVYALKHTSADYEKVKALGGEIIEFGSMKHWIYYLSAEMNISSQKEGKPNAAVCYLLEVYGLRKNRRAYLKHGVVHNDLKWHYKDVTKFWLYISTAQKEYDYSIEKFGYEEKDMALTGLCRYDNLDGESTDRKTVFIMPTRREWLARPIKEYQVYDDVYHFENTEYFKAWSGLLESDRVNACIEEKGLNVIFFLHPAMQKYSEPFLKLKTKAKIKTSLEVDLQEMMKRAGLMITDYSSVAFDFAFMKKPLLYFQFDLEKFREGNYQEGYFSYEADGFGPVCTGCDELVEEFCKLADADMEMPKQYKERAESFFAYHDRNNCERTYQAIRQKLEREK